MITHTLARATISSVARAEQLPSYGSDFAPAGRPDSMLSVQFRVCLQVTYDLSSRQHAFQMTVGNNGKLVEVVAAHRLQRARERCIGCEGTHLPDRAHGV